MNFIPIILGTDINAYGVARALHEAYGVTSYSYGRKALYYTRASNIVQVEVHEDFEDPEVFLQVLDRVYDRFKPTGKILLLIPCSDNYTRLMVQNDRALRDKFAYNLVDEAMQAALENKKDFYAICEQYGLDYPATYIINSENRDQLDLPFAFPIALKPNDSIEYVGLDFLGKKKAYKILDQAQLESVVHDIYVAGYSGDLIAQDFIPGDASTMAVLNAYVDRQGQVTMMCMGKCLLDECLPAEIGNYNALLTINHPEIYQQYQQFLEAIGYRGFANFDLKYDARSGKYMVFEINIRQGRSSYYMNAGGCNFMTYLVDDLILDKIPDETYYHRDSGLWLYVDPSVLKKYCNPKDRPLVDKYLKKGYKFTQWYEKDKSVIRFLDYIRRRISTIRYYSVYETARQED